MRTGKASWPRGALLLLTVLAPCLATLGGASSACAEEGPYEPTWRSLREHKEVPDWLRDGKFGIYTHWGPYAVHAHGKNTTWYSFGMYANPESDARKHFEKTFGSLDEIGYKDLIPKFTAEKFDADEWAELGLRLALGASRASVMGMVLSEGARLAAPGVLIGLAATLASPLVTPRASSRSRCHA